jgi:hypothetical protein
MVLTKLQKNIIQRIKDGEKLFYVGYTPGIHLAAHCYWEKDRGIPQTQNPIRNVKILINKKYVELKHLSLHGDSLVVLTNKK